MGIGKFRTIYPAFYSSSFLLPLVSYPFPSHFFLPMSRRDYGYICKIFSLKSSRIIYLQWCICTFWCEQYHTVTPKKRWSATMSIIAGTRKYRCKGLEVYCSIIHGLLYSISTRNIYYTSRLHTYAVILAHKLREPLGHDAVEIVYKKNVFPPGTG